MGLDRDTIDRAFQQHGAALEAYCRKRLDDPEDAADVAAGVWEEVVRKADQYEDRGWPLSAWIYRIAQSRCVDHLRRQVRRPTVSLRDDAPLAAPGGADPIPLDYAAVLSALTERQRLVLTLTLGGLRAPEIAERLGVEEGAVRALLHRARVTLRAELDRDLAPRGAERGADDVVLPR